MPGRNICERDNNSLAERRWEQWSHNSGAPDELRTCVGIRRTDRPHYGLGIGPNSKDTRTAGDVRCPFAHV